MDNIVLTKFEIVDGRVVVESNVELVKIIYNDTLNINSKIRFLKVNAKDDRNGVIQTKNDVNSEYNFTSGFLRLPKKSLELPDGEYVNITDFCNNIKKLCSKNDTIYILKSNGKSYKLSRGKLEDFREALSLCNCLKLVKEKNKSTFKLSKIYGKNLLKSRYEKIQIGILNSEDESVNGIYVSRNQLIAKTSILLARKRFLKLKKDILDIKKEEKKELINDEVFSLNKEEYVETQERALDDEIFTLNKEEYIGNQEQVSDDDLLPFLLSFDDDYEPMNKIKVKRK